MEQYLVTTPKQKNIKLWKKEWLVMGASGVLISNNALKYESKTIKYICNVLVFLSGGLGLLTACLTWISSKFK